MPKRVPNEKKTSPKHIYRCWGALRVSAGDVCRHGRWRPESRRHALNRSPTHLHELRSPGLGIHASSMRFPNADQSGAWNDGASAPVEITGIGFFDRPHKQIGRAPNNIEIHPILSIQFMGQPTPGTSPTPTSTPQPSPTGDQWEYQTISAANTTDLLNQANTQGTDRKSTRLNSSH